MCTCTFLHCIKLYYSCFMVPSVHVELLMRNRDFNIYTKEKILTPPKTKAPTTHTGENINHACMCVHVHVHAVSLNIFYVSLFELVLIKGCWSTHKCFHEEINTRHVLERHLMNVRNATCISSKCCYNVQNCWVYTMYGCFEFWGYTVIVNNLTGIKHM